MEPSCLTLEIWTSSAIFDHQIAPRESMHLFVAACMPYTVHILMHASMPNLGGQMEADNHPEPNTGVIGDGGIPYALLLHLPKKGLRGKSRCVLLRWGVCGRLVLVGQCATRAVSQPHLLSLFPQHRAATLSMGENSGSCEPGFFQTSNIEPLTEFRSLLG